MSIGIIGGADGPTAILIAGPDLSAYLICGVVLAAAAAVWFIICKRKKKHPKSS